MSAGLYSYLQLEFETLEEHVIPFFLVGGN